MKHKCIKAIMLLLLLCLTVYIDVQAQVRTKIFQKGIPPRLIPMNKFLVPEKIITPPDEFIKLLNQTKSGSGNLEEYSNRFAIPAKVNIDLLADAKAIEGNGTTTFAITINAEKALNISLRFNKFLLSKNSALSIYTETELTDSITSKENNKDQVWATRVYQGSSVTLVLRLPTNERSQVLLSIDKVNFGFKKFGGQFYGNPGASATCNINVLCPLGNGWENERNSVALIIANGNESCTGALIMNTCNTNIPYLLTANHCLEAGDVNNWVFQFQYWSATCMPNTDWDEDIQFNGCDLKANSAPSDFALLELHQTPDANSGITYSGWNRSVVPATSATGIHHPEGDLMKISHDAQPVVAVSYDGGPLDHWRAGYAQGNGIVQFGSSGSPLYDQNHRIVGQLHGNQNNICQSGDNNCWCVTQIPSIGEYGRFDVSWIGGGTNTTRLSNWLDPEDIGALTTNTTNMANLTNVNISVTGPNIICNTGTYSANTTLPVTWSATPANIINLTPNGDQLTVSKIADGYVTLKAVFSDCGTDGPIVKEGEITVGNPSAYDEGTYNDGGSGENQPLGTVDYVYNQTVYVTLHLPCDRYTWTEQNTQGNVYFYYPAYCNAGIVINYISPVYGDFIEFYVHSENECGSKDEPLFFYYAGPPYYLISPNPANNIVKISSIAPFSKNNLANMRAKKELVQHMIYAVKITDISGTVKKSKKYGEGTSSVNIPLSGIPAGTYLMSIFDGKKWNTQRFIIQK